ncbi:MAG: hypothetical protein P8P83_04595 [Rickettsiaceae bacterium]|nr:hypothetical protein [Rickettsiaceae bacterium]
MFKENSDSSLPCCSLRSIFQNIQNLGETIANLSSLCSSSNQPNQTHNYQSPIRTRENKNNAYHTSSGTSLDHNCLSPIIEREDDDDGWQDLSGDSSCYEDWQHVIDNPGGV